MLDLLLLLASGLLSIMGRLRYFCAGLGRFAPAPKPIFRGATRSDLPRLASHLGSVN